MNIAELPGLISRCIGINFLIYKDDIKYERCLMSLELLYMNEKELSVSSIRELKNNRLKKRNSKK